MSRRLGEILQPKHTQVVVRRASHENSRVQLRVIESIEGVTLVDDVLSMILPLRLSNTDMWRMQSEEVKLQHRADCERKLMALLQHIN
jgi:hypothetical protein